MSAGVAPPSHHRVDAGVVALAVDVRGRWDALALSELLIPFHSFLVQRTAESWVVHARVPGCHGEDLTAALAAIDGWRARREVDAVVSIDGELREIDAPVGAGRQ